MSLSNARHEPASRARMRALLLHSPGLHLREIARELSLPMGSALHHLDRLVADGTMDARRDGRYKRFFPAGVVDRGDRDAVSLLRRKTPRRILESLLHSPRTQRNLAESLGIARSTLSVALARLTETGLLIRSPRWPEDVWSVANEVAARALLGVVSPAAELTPTLAEAVA